MARVLPPSALLAWARTSVNSGDMPSLLALEDAGAFAFTLKDDQTIQNSSKLNPNTRPMIEALAELLIAPAGAEAQRREIFRVKDDFTGDVLDGSMSHYSLGVKGDYLEFFKRRVNEFTEQASTLLKENLYGPKTSAEATAGVLMGMAAALNDAPSIKVLGEAFPNAAKTMMLGLIPDRLLPQGDSFQPKTTFCTPSALAIIHGSRDALVALQKLGWKSSDPVLQREHIASDGNSREPVSFNSLKWAANVGQSGHLIGPPRVVEVMLKGALKEIKAHAMVNPGSALAENMKKDMKGLVQDISRDGWGTSILQPALVRLGVMPDKVSKVSKVSSAKNEPASDRVSPKMDHRFAGLTASLAGSVNKKTKPSSLLKSFQPSPR